MQFALKTQVCANLSCVFGTQSFSYVNRKRVDGIWIFFSYLLNVHSSFLAVYNAKTLIFTVVKNS